MTERTKTDVRCEIAKALGASIAHSGYTHSYQCTVKWQGKTVSAGSVERALTFAGIDFTLMPGDDGAALAALEAQAVNA